MPTLVAFRELQRHPGAEEHGCERIGVTTRLISWFSTASLPLGFLGVLEMFLTRVAVVIDLSSLGGGEFHC
jgi:hypothetical protein